MYLLLGNYTQVMDDIRISSNDDPWVSSKAASYNIMHNLFLTGNNEELFFPFANDCITK